MPPHRTAAALGGWRWTAETKDRSTVTTPVAESGDGTANNERNNEMATKTKAIEVKVDERLAEAISDKAVKAWHATNYSNGKKRVYVTFEEVVSA